MRTMLKVQVPVEAGNRAIKDGSLPKVIQAALEELRPEASYFLAEDGKRTMLLFIDLKETSQIPVTVERFFLELNASVSLIPVMNADELRTGLERASAKR
ncbi:MAG: hypothetical protein IT371_13075 [Deltaproteobacteria bacterium]|nr:hypothetical protein [Deltaproteobacteria bacterium]